MKTYSDIEIKKNFSKILDMVNKGEDIIISTEKSEEQIAVIISYTKYRMRTERPIGILKGKASYKIKDNFKLTDEEFILS